MSYAVILCKCGKHLIARLRYKSRICPYCGKAMILSKVAKQFTHSNYDLVRERLNQLKMLEASQ